MSRRIPSRAVLLGQLHCLSHDRRSVITGQHWQDPQPPGGRPTSWLRNVRNGRERQVLTYVGDAVQEELAGDWARISEMYAPTALTEEQMWVKLRELAGVEQVQCSSTWRCRGLLPPAWPYCPACGRDQRRVASGSLSGVRRMAPIVLDLRKPSS